MFMNSRAKNWFGGILLSLGIIILTFPLIYGTIFKSEVVVVSKPTNAKNPYTVMSRKYNIEKEKDWTDYGDKIVGWISALSGSVVLLCNAKKKMEEKNNG